MTVKGASIISGLFGFTAGALLMYLYMKSDKETKDEEVYIPKSEREKEETVEPVSNVKAGEIKMHYVPVTEDHPVLDDPVLEYVKAARNKTYSQSYNEDVEIAKDEMSISRSDKPYVIQPKECQELPGYNFFTLKYFNDGYLVDEQQEQLDDPERIVGNDFMNHFDEYEEGVVYIRNDSLEADFMIVHMDTNYSDTI